LSQGDWAAIQETLYLLSVKGMRESIRKGLRLLCVRAVGNCAGEVAGLFTTRRQGRQQLPRRARPKLSSAAVLAENPYQNRPLREAGRGSRRALSGGSTQARLVYRSSTSRGS